MVPLQAVLFDLDNTLFDHHGSAGAGLAGFLQHLGRTPARELERSWFEIEQRNYSRFLGGEFSFHEQRRERLRQFPPLAGDSIPPSDTTLDAVFAVYLENYEQAWAAFPDAVPALQRLRSIGIPVGVITNGNHQQQVSKIRRIGLERLIDRVFSSELTGFAKPDARAFLLPCRSMGVQPAATLYVGDNYLTDIAGARNAGLRAIHLKREGCQTPESIGSLEEVIKLTSIEAAN